MNFWKPKHVRNLTLNFHVERGSVRPSVSKIREPKVVLFS